MIKILLAIIFFAYSICDLDAGAIIFSDGLESGDLSNFSSTGGASAVSSESFAGQYALKMDYNNCSGICLAMVNLGEDAPQNSFYISYRIKIGASYNTPYLGFKFLRLKHGEIDGIQTELWVTSDGWFLGGNVYQTGATNETVSSEWVMDFADGNWHRIEVYGKYNTGGADNGILRIWMDATLRYENASFTWRSGDYANQVFELYYMPSNAGDGGHSAQAGDEIYLDDYQIWNGMPGSIVPGTGSIRFDGVGSINLN